ncbi:aldo/keto reductase [Stomatobaculum longum]|uniref:aldo/keto reductase n=1 Tax=Stomatobaculum longum TaxID=796942 RepID=UPI0028EB557B|nr:aldo/keto reductase [Stomatobaculum longum]
MSSESNQRQSKYMQVQTVKQSGEYGEIEGVGKKISRIFLGTAISPFLDGKEADVLLDQMYALGINAFDSARGYGLSERVLGHWIKHRKNRENVVILTKCGNADPTGTVHIDRAVMINELKQSLSELGTDYVDILLLHRDDANTPIAEYLETFNDFVREGIITSFGVSNWTVERIQEANAYAAEHGLCPFSISSPNFGLAEQVNDPWGGNCVTISGQGNKEVRDWYSRTNMPVLAYSALGRGFFSGRFEAGDYETAKSVLDAYAQKGYLYPVNMERLERCQILAEKRSCSVAQVAMSYIFSHSMNVFAVVSTTSPDRMKLNIEAAKLRLSEKEVIFLETGAR